MSDITHLGDCPHREVHRFISKHLHDWAGLNSQPLKTPWKLSDLERSEWSPNFEKLMRNRLLQGAVRYGKLHAPGKPQYDRVRGARKRLGQYEQTGNLELLVDVANMMLLEFEEGRHPLRHFGVTHDDHCCE